MILINTEMTYIVRCQSLTKTYSRNIILRFTYISISVQYLQMLENYFLKRIWNLTRIKYHIKHNTDTYSEIDSFTRWNWRPI